MKKSVAVIAVLSFCFALALYAANIWLGTLNLDEGWYLYAAKSFAAGKMPYRDFFFTQAPLLPAVYGALAGLWAGQGVLGGRLLTAGIGLAAAVLTAFLAATAVPRRNKFAAGITAFLLVAGNVYHSYFTAIPKTYSLASFFIAAGFLSLGDAGAGRDDASPRLSGVWTAVRAALCGLLLAFAACTRLSLGAMLAATGIVLLLAFRRCGFSWLWFGLGGILGLGFGLAPFVLGHVDAFAFANFFHGGRASGGLVFAAGSLSRLARNYMPVCLVALACLAMPLLGCRRPSGRLPVAPLVWLAAFGAAFAVHLLSPFPYDDYQVPLMPLLAAACSAFFWRKCGLDERGTMRLLGLFLFLAVVFAGTSPMNESWVVVRKDRFWVRTKERPDLAVLRKVGRDLSAKIPEDGFLLTQDTYLAVEAGCLVPSGFEMGPFGYFPALGDEEAAKFHVLNERLLEKAIVESSAPMAAFSGYAFSMAAPAMDCADDTREAMLGRVRARYLPCGEVADFGQEHTRLELFEKND